MRRAIGRGVKQLLIINAAVFVLGFLADPHAAFNPHDIGLLARVFGLERGDVLHGMVWQLVTYMFLHGSLLHIILNMMVLYFLGTDIESALGTKRFVYLYLGCGVLGGIGWLLLSGGGGSTCVGASGAVFGIVGAFAGMFPKRRLTVLVYFVIPVTMTALTLAIVFVVISLVMLFFGGGEVAHAAHLAGLAGGYYYGKYFAGAVGYSGGYGGGFGGSFRSQGAKWSWSDLKAKYRRSRYKVMPKNDEVPVDWAEVDAILDKIRFRGVNGLTREEKEVLDRAGRQRR
jgi:membrane associated rhomboid family serine protease